MMAVSAAGGAHLLECTVPVGQYVDVLTPFDRAIHQSFSLLQVNVVVDLL